MIDSHQLPAGTTAAESLVVAKVLFRLADYEGARKRFNEALKGFPDMNIAHFGRGLAAYLCGDEDAGLKAAAVTIKTLEPLRKESISLDFQESVFYANRAISWQNWEKKRSHLRTFDSLCGSSRISHWG